MRELRKDSRISFSEMRTKAGLLLSFFLPMILLLLVAYKFKIYPFSKDCLITDTLRDTYIPVISEWRRKAVNHETLFYTWNAGGGVNFWAWVSSYARLSFYIFCFRPRRSLRLLSLSLPSKCALPRFPCLYFFGRKKTLCRRFRWRYPYRIAYAAMS